MARIAEESVAPVSCRRSLGSYRIFFVCDWMGRLVFLRRLCSFWPRACRSVWEQRLVGRAQLVPSRRLVRRALSARPDPDGVGCEARRIDPSLRGYPTARLAFAC